MGAATLGVTPHHDSTSHDVEVIVANIEIHVVLLDRGADLVDYFDAGSRIAVGIVPLSGDHVFGDGYGRDRVLTIVAIVEPHADLTADDGVSANRAMVGTVAVDTYGIGVRARRVPSQDVSLDEAIVGRSEADPRVDVLGNEIHGEVTSLAQFRSPTAPFTPVPARPL